MTKQFFLAIFFAVAAVFTTRAQSITEMEIEKTEGSGGVMFLECNDPAYGVLVFTSTIQGLQFRLNLPSKLIHQAYRQSENRYILCVEPTDRRYIVTISCPTCEAVNYTVEEIMPSKPQYFRIKDKQPPIISLSAQEQYDLGFAEYGRGNFAQAEQRYQNAVDLTKADPVFDFLRALGDVFMKRNKYAEAVTSLKQAATLRPNNAEIHHMLGTAYFGQSSYENAANSFKAAADLASNNAQYRADFLKAMNANPQKAKSYFDMGNASMDQYKYAEALNYFKEAVTANPNNTSYQTAVKTAETRISQERYMAAAEAAYQKAKATPEPTYTKDSNGNLTASSQAAKNKYEARYQPMLDEINKATALGALPHHMQESVSFFKYSAELDLAGGCQHVSPGWIDKFLKENPETPFRDQILACRKVANKTFFGEAGANFAFNNMLDISGFLGFKLGSCDKLVNFHIALQYAWLNNDYFDTKDGAKKPDNDNTWKISANQLSVPVTLQLNIVPIGKNSSKPQSVFVAAIAQPQYNLNGTCFGQTSSDFVNSFGVAGAVSLGYSNKTFSLSVFARKNFTNIFKRDEIMLQDNSNSKNDYKALDKCLENKLMFGATLSVSLSL